MKRENKLPSHGIQVVVKGLKWGLLSAVGLLLVIGIEVLIYYFLMADPGLSFSLFLSRGKSLLYLLFIFSLAGMGGGVFFYALRVRKALSGSKLRLYQMAICLIAFLIGFLAFFGLQSQIGKNDPLLRGMKDPGLSSSDFILPTIFGILTLFVGVFLAFGKSDPKLGQFGKSKKGWQRVLFYTSGLVALFLAYLAEVVLVGETISLTSGSEKIIEAILWPVFAILVLGESLLNLAQKFFSEKDEPSPLLKMIFILLIPLFWLTFVILITGFIITGAEEIKTWAFIGAFNGLIWGGLLLVLNRYYPENPFPTAAKKENES